MRMYRIPSASKLSSIKEGLAMNQNDRHWIDDGEEYAYLDYVMAHILVFLALCGLGAITAMGLSLLL
jgi:hypothetical protein